MFVRIFFQTKLLEYLKLYKLKIMTYPLAAIVFAVLVVAAWGAETDSVEKEASKEVSEIENPWSDIPVIDTHMHLLNHGKVKYSYDAGTTLAANWTYTDYLKSIEKAVFRPQSFIFVGLVKVKGRVENLKQVAFAQR